MTAFEDNNRAYLTAALTWLRLRLQAMALARGTVAPAPAKPSEHTAASDGESWPSAAPRQRWFGRPASVAPATPLPEPIPAPDAKAANADAMSRADQAVIAARDEVTKAGSVSPAPAMSELTRALGLSSFERDTLLLCAAMELDPAIPELCARAYGSGATPWPSFGCALQAFDEPRWDAMSPERPLRQFRLVEVHQSGVQPLIAAPLRIDERIASYIAGLNYLDERLMAALQTLDQRALAESLTWSQQQAVEHALDAVTINGAGAVPDIVMQVAGADSSTRRAISSAIGYRLGARLLLLTAENLPPASETDAFINLWRRERHLLPLALLIELPDTDASAEGAPDAQTPTHRLLRIAARSGGLILVSAREVGADALPGAIVVDVQKATVEEQEDAWLLALGEDHVALADDLAAQFSLDVPTIAALARREVERTDPGTPLRDRLWRACVQRSRPALEGLAQRIEPRASWDALKLPEREAETLARVRDRLQHRATVHGRFGFRRHLTRGLGTAVLFCGEPGTGKTFAAEVLAASLHLPLYRIDLAGMMNKYIGVTEKHMRQVFDAAEGAVLLFDEADALFSKRSEVKDSHDRYANIQVDYLLQRMESYAGLAILATNLRSAIDPAFLRRLDFVVNFPFPGPRQREEIWRNAFPGEVPLAEDVDFARLSTIPLTGGSIQNVALDASFRAAARGSQASVSMALIIDSAGDELRKLEQPPGSSMSRLSRASRHAEARR